MLQRLIFALTYLLLRQNSPSRDLVNVTFWTSYGFHSPENATTSRSCNVPNFGVSIALATSFRSAACKSRFVSFLSLFYDGQIF